MRRAPSIDLAVLAALCLLPLVIGLYHDPWRSYITTPDADIVFVHEALRINDGLPQQEIAHTGYTYVLFLAWWYKLLGVFDLVPLSRVSDLPTGDSFYRAYEVLVFAGRWFSALLGGIFVLSAYTVLRQFAERATAIGLSAVVASSIGVASHAVILRTELLSAAFSLFAFSLLLDAGRRRGAAVPIWIGTAAVCVVLSLGAKMQSIFLFIAFPALLIVLRGKWRWNGGELREDLALLWLLGGLALSVPAGIMVLTSIYHPRSLHGPTLGSYQFALAIWIAACWFAYAALRKVPRYMVVGCTGALLGGLAVGLMAHLIRNDPSTVDALVKFGEHMSLQSGPMARSFSFTRAVTASIGLVGQTITLRFAPHDFAQLASSLIYWACLIGVATALLRGHRVAALQAGAFLFFALLLDVAFSLRGLYERYFIYSEIWPIVGLAVLAPTFEIKAGAVRRVAIIGLTAWTAVNLVAASNPAVVPVQPRVNACHQMEDKDPRVRIPFEIYCRT